MVQSYLVTHQSEDIDKIWLELEPLIKKVLIKQETEYTIDSIKDMLLNKHVQLWTSYNGQIEAFVLTHIAIYPNQKICEIFMCGGSNLGNWLGFMSNIEDWAISLGCKLVRLQGRKGWMRKLSHIGFKQTKIIMQKELWAEVNHHQ